MTVLTKVLTNSAAGDLPPNHGWGRRITDDDHFPFKHPFTRRCMPFDMRKVRDENTRLGGHGSRLLWASTKTNASGEPIKGYLKIMLGAWDVEEEEQKDGDYEKEKVGLCPCIP